MANHVNNRLTFDEISDEGLKVWQEQFVDKISGTPNFDLRQFFFEIEGDQYVDFDYSVVENKIGAKWATVEDEHDGLNVTSAWSAIIPFAAHVAETIGKVDPDVRLVLTYEDEFPNFVGVATFTAEGLDTDNEWDSEEIRDRMIANDDELRELWDSEEEDWIEDKEEEAEDIMSDIQWETINDMQVEGIEWTDNTVCGDLDNYYGI